MATDRPLLTLAHLRIGYGREPLLPELSLQVCPGQLWVLAGRNGSGKTTLLRTLTGELRPLGGAMVRAEGTTVSLVVQRPDLDPWVPRTVRDVVGEGLDRGWGFLRPRWGRRRSAALATVDKVLAEVHAADLAARQYRELSEGQKPRVQIARAIVSNPRLLLLDEPTSAMDPANERMILRLIRALAHDRQMGVIVSLHHAEGIPELADHAVFLDRDLQVAVAGSADAIRARTEFRRRYGLGGEVTLL